MCFRVGRKESVTKFEFYQLSMFVFKFEAKIADSVLLANWLGVWLITAILRAIASVGYNYKWKGKDDGGYMQRSRWVVKCATSCTCHYGKTLETIKIASVPRSCRYVKQKNGFIITRTAQWRSHLYTLVYVLFD